ncbi:MAG: plasmid recombination protein [Clostridiales bacterium]|nr:plasmid recombination protein [Clostridiales bacterium]
MKGKGSLAHNNREFIEGNVDFDRVKDNVYYKQESLEAAYTNCFAEAIENYNAKQKRKDRRIAGVKGYMEQIKNSGNREKLFYESVIQVGNIYDSAVGTEQGELCKTILDEYMKDFEERNPNLYVFNAVMHCDECTPHLHIDYIPLGRGYKQGLMVRNSLDRAFKQQGIDGKANKKENSTIAWQNREKSALEEVMNRHGVERAAETGLHRENQSVEQFKATVHDTDNRLQQLPQQIEYMPAMFNKEKAVVNTADLKKIEEEAKLLTIKENNLVNLEKQETEKLAVISYYSGYKAKYEEAAAECEKQAEIIKEKDEVIEAQESTIKEQTETIDGLNNFKRMAYYLIEDISRSCSALMQSITFIRDRFCGQFTASLMDGLLEYGNRSLKHAANLEVFDLKHLEKYCNPEPRLMDCARVRVKQRLYFKDGSDGTGLYTENDNFVLNFDSAERAKKFFPYADIVDSIALEKEKALQEQKQKEQQLKLSQPQPQKHKSHSSYER